MSYAEHEVFLLPWHFCDEGESSYYRLFLVEVSCEYRLYLRKGMWQLWTRYATHTPWKLGIWHSLPEGKYHAYHHILTYKIYETGEWNPQRKDEIKLITL